MKSMSQMFWDFVEKHLRGPRGHMGAMGAIGAPGVSCHEAIMFIRSGDSLAQLTELELRMLQTQIELIRPLHLKSAELVSRTEEKSVVEFRYSNGYEDTKIRVEMTYSKTDSLNQFAAGQMKSDHNHD